MNAIARIAVALALAGAATISAAADHYPDRPIHWVVPYPPGGTTDVVARAIAQRMGERLGVPIVVDNRGGAGGMIGVAFVAHAEADGYTLLVSDASVATAPSLYKSLSFDPVKDLVPIASFVTVPHVLVVDPALPIRDVPALVASSRNSRLNFSSGGIGSPLHLAGEAFRAASGIVWTHVPYRGAGPAILAVIGGQAQVATPSLPSALPQIAGGKLRALAVTSAKRVASLPDVPSMTELGFPGATVNGWIGLHAPRGVPAAALARLEEAAAEAIRSPALLSLLHDQGADLAFEAGPAYGRRVADETARWARVVKQAGIAPE